MWGLKEGAFLFSVLMGGWRPGWTTPPPSSRGHQQGAPIPGLAAVAREVIHTKHCARRVQEMEAKLGERFGPQEDRRVGSGGFLKSQLLQCHPSSTPGGTHPGWRPVPGGVAGGQGEGSVQTCPPSPA